MVYENCEGQIGRIDIDEFKVLGKFKLDHQYICDLAFDSFRKKLYFGGSHGIVQWVSYSEAIQSQVHVKGTSWLPDSTNISKKVVQKPPIKTIWTHKIGDKKVLIFYICSSSLCIYSETGEMLGQLAFPKTVSVSIKNP